MEQNNLFPKGTLLQIICKSNEAALRIDNVQQHSGSKVSGAAINPQDVPQLWYLDKINNGKDYEFANALSGFVFDESGGIIYLNKGVWGKNQMFKVEKAPYEGFYEYYWFKLSKNQSKAVSFQGILRCVDFDQNDEKQMFRFQQVYDNLMLNRTVLIMNAKAQNKVIDVPGASDKECEEIIQYQYNNRFNQRWLLVKTGASNNYQIQSFKTGLNLDIYGESKKPGTKVIQYKRTAAPNQLWTLQHQDNQNYYIRSVLSQNLYLSTEGNSIKDLAKIVVDTTPTLWKIKGEAI